MKIKRIILTALSAILVFLMSAFFCACDLADLISPGNHEHSFINYVADGNATCTQNGTETAKCEGCDETDTREIANSKLKHSFTDYIPDDNATCTKNGTETAKCENCNETYTREIAHSELGHSFVNYISDDNATCTKNGTETAKCDNCNETDTRVVADSKLHHSFENYISDDNATCTEDGTETAKCDNCNETDTRVVADSKTGHSFTNYIPDGNATTEEDGTKTAKCDRCEQTDTIIDEGSKLEAEHTHVYTETVFDPTCTERGYTHYECECGESEYKDKFVDALGHSFKIYEPDNNATCTEDGTETANCERCEEIDVRDIADSKLGHSFTDYVENPDGSKTAKCDRCEEIDTIQKEKPEATEFSIHFIELGNGNAGDCVLIDCGDTEVLIDAGSKRDSTATVKKYISQYCTDGVLEYVIATHAHEDHIAALVGETNKNNGVMYSYKIGTIITYAGHNTTSQVSKDFETAITYAVSQGAARYTASQCYNETDGAKRQYYLDEAHTVSFNILYNYYYDHSSSDENEYSVVTLLTQELESGNKHYLFTGDLEESGESRMVDYYKNSANSKSEFDILPKVVLYKAGHHGSKTSSSAKLLQIIQPEYVAVCCCCGQPEYTTTNANTFPTQQMLDNVSKYTDKIYVTSLATNLPSKDANGDYVAKASKSYTSMNGDIRFFIKGDELELSCTNNNTILKETDWFKENRVWNG